MATIRVPIGDDRILEPDESFRVVLSNPSLGSALGPITSAEVIIHDNDPTVSFFAASTERGAQLLGTIVLFPMMMIGGSFFPFEAMPSWMAAVGRWTPNGVAVVRLREIIDGRVDPATLAVSALAITVPALVTFWLASRRLAGRFSFERDSLSWTRCWRLPTRE